MSAIYKFTYTFIIALLAIILGACSDKPSSIQCNDDSTQGVSVEVAEVISQRITEWDSFTGRLEPPKIVSLRPRVSGYIEAAVFEEGELVNKGDTLFLIDSREFNAQVNRLTAQLDEAKSRLKLAKQDFNRAKELFKSKSISKELLETRGAEVDQANAYVAQSNASLELAQLNKTFTRVEAPISGRVSRALITEGNYVSAGQTEMTSIVSTEQVYAYFDIDEATWLNYQQAHLDNNQSTALPVAMRLANEQDYQHWGKLDFVDNQVNTQTGTLRVRAVFNNQDGALLPGLFAHLKLAGGNTEQGILIAEKAIGTDLNNKYVLTVDEQNKVQYRAITLGDKVGELRVIKQGLKSGERIVVNGLQRVRSGVLIKPELINMAKQSTLNELQAWQQKVDNQNRLANAEPTLEIGM
ncbi:MULTISPECIES: efflux RND transporter periplasmic adaptor subunit [unclassified Pseudoalteromonas]|uniref:efflux RND transporter periplasmic adaptor subunit n=1 Tax=unclassified Pseudoalteromonas TaxID=194690 RepID=UPI002358A361|nr:MULTISPECIES: efflux RND transporter periplasmic adaptor subunit [unclassified Pseudoalteromonas]MDC9563656.1 efflux RND transporter periplasmic adaptor subunit [Pseudoalteromonas sp. GAB2316C]MDC9568216.1 efflux RND transporter periplasmic adaptor subunit [Pseudoalteromonas sp. GABNB9D]MDC9571565.1 efflux RND transporter periplasmic adaptor subunit [Pseudoalteromonas sp. GABNS16A]MDC9575968.1 efflux RND transporter periplasmic adaptor subunit [Pseudoalteromonas sp. GABNS16E]MDC9584102.1 ef